MFAVLLLPQFRLQAALRLRDELRCVPVAIVDERHGKGAILELNTPAAQAGVAAGMASVQALARCPILVLQPPSVAQECIAQAALIEIASSLSPDIEATADGYCTVDMRTVPVGDWQVWGRCIVETLDSLCLQVRVGVGPNPDLAFLAARRAEPVLVVQTPAAFLAQLAVAEIDPPPDLLAVLRDWGIHNLGQLTSLPRGELADRLGPEADRLWQRAAGQTQRLLRLVRPTDELAETFDFEQEIETVEPLLFMLRRFLDQLGHRLAAVHRVAAKMILTLPLDNGTSHGRTFTIPAPTADAEVLFRILSTHLDGLQLDHRPVSIRLLIEPVRSDHQQLRLFESPLRDANQFGETLARLTALVGVGNVGVAEVDNTHRADCFRIVEPRFHEFRGEDGEDVDDDLTVGLPLRRFRPPLVAQVHVVRHQPVHVFSEQAHGSVCDALGPYRATGGWWNREQWGTEEWDVEIAGCGLFRLSRQNDQWFVEGCYDAELR